MPFIRALLLDGRHSLRRFCRTPGFSGIAILVLALGIGTTTAVYSVVNAVLLRPLPYPHAEQLVRIVDNVPADESPSGAPVQTAQMTQDAFLWWREHTRTLSEIAAYLDSSMTSVGRSETIRVSATRVSPSLFAMLGVVPASGRVLTAADERATHVVVVSARALTRLVGESTNVVGRTLVLDGAPYTVVGVVPAEFEFPSRQTEVWIPYVVTPDSAVRVFTVDVLARLKDGVSIQAAARDANVIGNAFVGLPAPGEPDAPSPARFGVVRMQDHLVAPVRPALWAMTTAVALLLVITCANTANLLMSRNATRRRELWIRRALGAGQLRLISQLVTESLLLSLAGGAAGVVVAAGGVWLGKTLTAITRPSLYGGNGTLLPGVEGAGLDGRVLMFMLGCCVVTGVASSLVPALHLSADSGRTMRARITVSAAELALATLLLIGAGLLMHSFARLSGIDHGYDPSHTLTFEMVTPADVSGDRKLAVAVDLERRLRTIPGVRAVGFSGGPPLSAMREGWGLSRTPPTPGAGLDRRLFVGDARRVSPEYLRAIGARLVEGRWTDAHDASVQPHRLLVNRSLARQLFAGQSPLGRQVYMGLVPMEIVGVVDDMRGEAVDDEPVAEAYVDPVAMQNMAREQRYPDFPTAPAFLSFAVRVSRDAATVLPGVRASLRELEPAAAVDGAIVMDQIVSVALARPRFLAILPTLFASVAAILAVVGIYGVVSNGVALRTREIGVRLALGAAPSRVMRMVLREAAAVAAVGIGTGLTGAVALTRFMRGLLFGVGPLDPLILVAVPAIFALVTIIAAFGPSRRAMRLDPATVLRHE
jgi:predicted permease